MPNRARPIIGLDASLFIAWLTGEQRPDDQAAGIQECFERIRKDEIQAIVSAVLYSEILLGQYPEDKQLAFYKLMSGTNPQVMEVDIRIARTAGELRTYFNTKGMKMSTPDAVHISTAIHYGAHEFYTVDEGLTAKLENLLDLSAAVEGCSLVVRIPPSTTPMLGLKGKSAQSGS